MSVPDVRAAGGIFTFSWPDNSVTVRVDRIIDDKRGASAELSIKNTDRAFPPHIEQSRLNMTSAVSKKSFVAALEVNYPGIPDWRVMIEQVCVKVLMMHREGAPLVQISSHPAPDRVQYRIYPFVIEKQPIVIFGDGDSGKSMLAIRHSIGVCTGIPGAHLSPEPGNALYIDYETDADSFWRRVNIICAGLNIPLPDNLYYLNCYQTVADSYEMIQGHVLEKEIDFVVVDSAALAVENPLESADVSRYFRALRALQVSSETIAHITKGGDQTKAFGSAFWHNLPRATYRIDSSRESDEFDLVMGIRNTKGNDAPRWVKPYGIGLSFGEQEVTFHPTDPIEVDDLAEIVPLRERIKRELNHGALSTKDLAESLHTAEATVRTTLSRGSGNLFVKVGPNWGLVAQMG